MSTTEATPEKPINASTLTFPGTAGWGSLIVAIGAAIVTFVNGTPLADIPNSVQVGILGVIGAGLLAAAIASAGDAVARSYVVANTVETKTDEVKVKPALQVAGDALAQALSGAQPAAAGQTPAPRDVVPLPVPLELSIDGNDNWRAVAARAGDDGLEYLAAPPGQQLRWRKEAEVRRGQVVAAPRVPQIVALPNPVAVTWNNIRQSAILVKVDDGRPTHFLVGAPGETYEWRPAAEVKAR